MQLYRMHGGTANALCRRGLFELAARKRKRCYYRVTAEGRKRAKAERMVRG